MLLDPLIEVWYCVRVRTFVGRLEPATSVFRHLEAKILYIRHDTWCAWKMKNEVECLEHGTEAALAFPQIRHYALCLVPEMAAGPAGPVVHLPKLPSGTPMFLEVLCNSTHLPDPITKLPMIWHIGLPFRRLPENWRIPRRILNIACNLVAQSSGRAITPHAR